jgi:hypothetical protein
VTFGGPLTVEIDNERNLRWLLSPGHVQDFLSIVCDTANIKVPA